MSSELRYKVVLVGDAGVGKSNIHHCFLRGEFYDRHTPTVGVDFGVMSFDLGDKPVTLNIWDTAGQERFRSLTTRLFTKGARGVLLVYDVTTRRTFDNVDEWVRLMTASETTEGTDLVYLLVGNKTDLQDEREVTLQEALHFADMKNMLFVETSAKTGDNIHQAFRLLAAEIHRRDLFEEKKYELNNNLIEIYSPDVHEHNHQCFCST